MLYQRHVRRSQELGLERRDDFVGQDDKLMGAKKSLLIIPLAVPSPRGFQ